MGVGHGRSDASLAVWSQAVRGLARHLGQAGQGSVRRLFSGADVINGRPDFGRQCSRCLLGLGDAGGLSVLGTVAQ